MATLAFSGVSTRLIGGQPGAEGIWKRAARDTGEAAHSLAFVVAEVLAAGICAAIGALILADPDATTAETALVSGLSVVVGLVVVLLIVFVSSLLRVPVKQRDEARKQIDPEFPRHALDIKPAWYLDRETDSGEDRVIWVEISYTNREPSQRASLEFEVIAQLHFGDGTWSTGSQLFPYRRPGVPNTLGAPLSVAPETTERGDLLFDGKYELGFDFEENGSNVFVKEDWRVHLHVIDHVSGARIERELPPPRAKLAESAALNQ